MATTETWADETLRRLYTEHCTACARAWLRGVAHNIVVDRVQARRCRPTEVDGSTTYHLAVDDHADRIVTAGQVAIAVRGLVPEHRAVLYQVYVAGRDAAAARSVTENAVPSRAAKRSTSIVGPETNPSRVAIAAASDLGTAAFACVPARARSTVPR